jgi:hypothetical protein
VFAISATPIGNALCKRGFLLMKNTSFCDTPKYMAEELDKTFYYINNSLDD